MTGGRGDATDSPASETSAADATDGPYRPLPPGLDAWGFALTWTGIVGDRFAITDVDGDGHVDVSAHLRSPRDADSWSLTTHVGRGDGSFDARAPTQAIWDRDFVFGDLDGDGRTELLAFTVDRPRVLEHSGDGRFTMSSPAEFNGGAGFMGAVLDVDGDGLDDVMLGPGLHSTPGSVMLNHGGYVFEGSPELPYPACYFVEMLPVDPDGDGDIDLFATGGCNSGSPDYSWYGFYENAGGTLALTQTFPGDPTPRDGTRPGSVDFDADGREDLAMAAGTWTNQDGITSTGLLMFINQAAATPYTVEYFEHEWARGLPEVFGLRVSDEERGAVLADQGEHDSQLLLRATVGDGLEVHDVWIGGRGLDVADFDEDGRPDLGVTRAAADGVELGIWLSGG